MQSSTTRFSDRVADYIKYRPGYPKKVIDILTAEAAVKSDSLIVDIGSGTGISSALFLSNGNILYAVEPNTEMRLAAESAFKNDDKFISVNGTAEHTNLEEGCIDFIFSGQAFHWFNRDEAKIEFNRILKPGGHVALVWNIRKQTVGFLNEYEALLKTIPEYKDVAHTNITDEEIKTFFSPNLMHKNVFDNYQSFDIEGLKGRLRSSSYCPKDGPEYLTIMQKTEDLFYKYEKDGLIKFEYETVLYWR